MADKKPATIDEYLDTAPAESKSDLVKLRKFIAKLAPDATEAMAYGIPTFKLNGKNLAHFAGYKEHIGFYPTPNGIDSLKDETEPYRSGKGTMKFEIGAIPFDLVEKIIKLRISELG